MHCWLNEAYRCGNTGSGAVSIDYLLGVAIDTDTDIDIVDEEGVGEDLALSVSAPFIFFVVVFLKQKSVNI